MSAELMWFGAGVVFIFGIAFGRWVQWMRDAKYISHFKEVEDQLRIWEMSRD